MLDIETTIAPRAWRVEFAEGSKAPSEGVETIEVTEPRNVTALLIPVAPSDALAQAGPQTAGALTVVWMSPGANTPATIERDVDEWMRGAGTERKETNVRAEVRTLRVVWDKSRAVIYANEGDLRFALDAIVRFSVAQREALALEATMKSTWASIEADAALAHVQTRDHQRQRHVSEMMEAATRMRMAWLRVSRSIEQLDPALAAPSKRLFAELVAAASLYDQVEMLEDSIQFAFEHYEISNTRLIDMVLVRQERVDSIVGYGVITALLIVQIFLMLQGL